MQKAELLLPVGDINMCLAAIHNGADAIYVGMPGFNARGRSKDFDLTELKEMIDMCHLYGVKVHLAFNVLIFENELAQAIELLKQVIPLGVDAFIVQDLGLVQIIKMLAPTQVVHGSTQMTVTNHNAIAFLDDLGIKRFVLGRENSIDEIKIIRENTTKELEVFVHGALCVAYSGQCLTSEAIGGRSANRGQCAQSCRFSYEMLVDGKKIALNEKKYLVSPQDLCGIEHVATLQEIGVDSFKIEGRLKTPQYVAVTARHYKNVMQGLPSNEQMQHEMAMTYSRGFFSGWLKGVDHQRLARADYSAHRGQFIGTVNKNSNNKISIETKTELQAGDGLLIVQHGQEMGGKIFDLKKDKCYEIILKDFKTTQDLKGASVYKNSDPKLFSQLEKSFTGKDLLKKIPIHITLKAAVGEKLTLIYEDGLNIVERVSEEELQPAMTELNREQVAAEISALGNTIYKNEKLHLDISAPTPFIPNKALKKLRQEVTAKLNEARLRKMIPAFQTVNFPLAKSSASLEETSPKLNILLREFSQVEALTQDHSLIEHSPLGIVILDFEFGRDYAPALEMLRAKKIHTAIATTRILKPNEYYNLNTLIRLNPDAILVRNLGAAEYLNKRAPQLKLMGDFSLNVTNSLTANYLLKKGLNSLVPSYDLNFEQLQELLKTSAAQNFEVTLHHYIPGFHMEHCVFAAFLSKGSSFKDCGKPCEKHRVELKDQFGNHHFLRADQECRNTMFNAEAQSLSLSLNQLQNLGVNKFRFEALSEQGSELTSKIKNYMDFLNQKIEASELATLLGQQEKYGLNTLKIFKKDDYADRKRI